MQLKGVDDQSQDVVLSLPRRQSIHLFFLSRLFFGQFCQFDRGIAPTEGDTPCCTAANIAVEIL